MSGSKREALSALLQSWFGADGLWLRHILGGLLFFGCLYILMNLVAFKNALSNALLFVQLPSELLVETVDLICYSATAIPLLLLIKLVYRVGGKAFSLDWGLGLRGNWWAYLAAGLCLGVLAHLAYIVLLLPGGYWSDTPALGTVSATKIVAEAMNALTEELLFRAFLFQLLCRWGSPFFALLASSALFALPHVVPLATFTSALSTRTIALFGGFMFAYAFRIRGRLWLPIGLHFAWNALGPIFKNVLCRPASPLLDGLISTGIVGVITVMLAEWMLWQTKQGTGIRAADSGGSVRESGDESVVANWDI